MTQPYQNNRDAWLANLGRLETVSVGQWQPVNAAIALRRVVKLPPLADDGTRTNYRYAIEARDGDKLTISPWSEGYPTESAAEMFGDMALAEYLKSARTRLAASASATQDEAAPPIPEAEWLDRDHHLIREAFPAFSIGLFGRDLSGHFLDHAEVRQVRLAADRQALHVRLADGTPLKCHPRGLDLCGPHNDGNIRFIVETAQALAWNRVTVSGGPEFTAAVTLALQQAGITVTAITAPDSLPSMRPAAQPSTPISTPTARRAAP